MLCPLRHGASVYSRNLHPPSGPLAAPAVALLHPAAMDFVTNERSGIYIRTVAIIALLLGLSDAARLLGVSSGDISPIAQLGPAGFTYLAIFASARLFAAVGLWIKASWGAVLLVAATGTEMVLFLLGSRDVQMDGLGFAVRLVLLTAILLVFVLAWRVRRERVHD